MFGHKARQFAEFERRQAPAGIVRGGLAITYRPSPLALAMIASRTWGYSTTETTFSNDAARTRFRGYAYKGVAGKA